MPRTGRRPGPSTSRAEILAVARRYFAERGFDGASMRAIAAEVGVDPAVVVHFFGSKDGLFRAAVGWPFDPELAAATFEQATDEPLAARVARAFFRYWEDPASQPALLALLRSAMSHETAAGLLREFAVKHLFAHVARLAQGPDVQLRVELAAAQLIGVAVLRHGLRVEPIASASSDELVAMVAPALSLYLEPAAMSAPQSPAGETALRPKGAR